jgi:glucose-1-phosphate cytidylyltransferase
MDKSVNELTENMKVVILAGGFGTRISEESKYKPKPMVEIGGKPILWHIMKIYSSYGFNDFIISLGYKGHKIKEYFEMYGLNSADVTYHFGDKREKTFHKARTEPWKVTLVETGENTMTGGRIKRVSEYIGRSPFLLTYGDGVADVNISELVKFHLSHGKLATVTVTQPEGRFGAIEMSERNEVLAFKEKPKGDGAWINSGFFVMQPEALKYIEGDETVLEREPLEGLAADGQMMAFKHDGFWHPMDSLKDKNELEALWTTGRALWKTW